MSPARSAERPWVGLSLMPEGAFRDAAAPLFAAGSVDALEWSFELGWNDRRAPWLDALLLHYAAAGRLFGHGVHYSPLSARWEARQARWLDALGAEIQRTPYAHFSEHYGFMTAPPFVRGAPLPPPRGAATLAVGRDRLLRLRERLNCPVGLENLALAWNRNEALAHGAFLDALLDHAEDFMVLDVHNLYCQAMNFEIEADALLSSFPLERVREIHVSGGSWLPAWPAAAALVRCDTHDESVPAPVFELLGAALDACPNVRVVFFERLGHSIESEADARQLRADFERVRAIVADRVASPARGPAALHPAPTAATEEADEASLARFQSALLALLSRTDLEEDGMRRELAASAAFAPFRRTTEAFDGRALGIAARVARKWLRA